jgi:hypothetical protein
MVLARVTGRVATGARCARRGMGIGVKAQISRELLRLEVLDTVAGFTDDFDIDGIVEEIVATYGLVWPDTINSRDCWALVERHDQSEDEKGAPA